MRARHYNESKDRSVIVHARASYRNAPGIVGNFKASDIFTAHISSTPAPRGDTDPTLRRRRSVSVRRMNGKSRLHALILATGNRFFSFDVVEIPVAQTLLNCD